MILAGIDEAGYGPTLGPLVVSVSLFRAPDRLAGSSGDGAGASARDGESSSEAPNLWRLLQRAVCRKPGGSRVAVNDSKKLFHQTKGCRDLEEGVLPFILLREGALPRDLRSLLRVVARRGARSRAALDPADSADSYLDLYPWYRGRDVELPFDTYALAVSKRAQRLADGLAAVGVEFLGLAAWPVEVLEFNRGVDETDNKSFVSFAAVSAFLRRLWKQFPLEAVDVMVDRQGGRMRYAPLLFEKMRPLSIRIEAQSENLSVYQLRRAARGPGARAAPFRVTFATDCEERSLPVALASMLSKYLREMHMVLFNRFWKEHRPDLKPTAGYALDAHRFLEEITPLRKSLGIDDEVLVRRR